MSAFQTGPTAKDGGFPYEIRLLPSKPAIFPCHECQRKFPTRAELTAHGFSAHPKQIPRIAIDGVVLASSGPAARTFAPIEPDRIRIQGTDSARIGGKDVLDRDIPRAIANLSSGSHEIILQNAHGQCRHTLRIHVTNDQDLSVVDDALRRYLLNSKMTAADRTVFLQEAEQASTAGPYLDGIHQYLVGRIAKDSLEDDSIGFDRYREEYNNAAVTLSRFDRPVARVICTLVRVHLNLVDQVAGMIPGSTTDAAARYFLNPSDPLPPIHPPDHGGVWNLERTLADRDTAQFLSWFHEPTKNRELVLAAAMAAQNTFATSFDQAKAALVTAHLEAAKGLTPSAIQFLRRLRKHPQFANFVAHVEPPASLPPRAIEP